MRLRSGTKMREPLGDVEKKEVDQRSNIERSGGKTKRKTRDDELDEELTLLFDSENEGDEEEKRSKKKQREWIDPAYILKPVEAQHRLQEAHYNVILGDIFEYTQDMNHYRKLEEVCFFLSFSPMFSFLSLFKYTTCISCFCVFLRFTIG